MKKEIKERLEALKGLPIVYISAGNYVYPDPQYNWGYKMSLNHEDRIITIEGLDGLPKQKVMENEYLVGEDCNVITTKCYSRFLYRILHVKDAHIEELYRYEKEKYLYGYVPPVDFCQSCPHAENGKCKLRDNEDEYEEIHKFKRQLFHPAKLAEI